VETEDNPALLDHLLITAAAVAALLGEQQAEPEDWAAVERGNLGGHQPVQQIRGQTD